MTVRLRPLVSADLPTLVRLEGELFGAGSWSRAALAEELDGPGRWYVGAVDQDDALVGYAGLWFDGQDAQVMTIGTARDRQGRGIGRRMLLALVARARELGARAMLLEVRVDNDPALHLYSAVGFERLGVRRGYYQPENVDAWTMRLDLSRTGAADGAAGAGTGAGRTARDAEPEVAGADGAPDGTGAKDRADATAGAARSLRHGAPEA